MHLIVQLIAVTFVRRNKTNHVVIVIEHVVTQ